MTTCPFCNQPSHAKACPQLRAVLFASTNYRCNSCGDPLDTDGLCGACRETGEYLTQIVYDRTTGDYAMILDGETIGMARTMHEADVTLSQLILELKQGERFVEAA